MCVVVHFLFERKFQASRVPVVTAVVTVTVSCGSSDGGDSNRNSGDNK